MGEDGDAGGLFEAAMQRAVRRVVVKRHLHADPISQAAPTVTHRGKSVRYDVYAMAGGDS